MFKKILSHFKIKLGFSPTVSVLIYVLHFFTEKF